MVPNPSRLLLMESIDELRVSLGHLDYSLQSLSNISVSFSLMNDEQLQVVEAYTSRFSRVVDLFINKTLIPSADWLRELKDVRNQIAHDYSGAQMEDILKFCSTKTKELVDACEKTISYAKDRL